MNSVMRSFLDERARGWRVRARRLQMQLRIRHYRLLSDQPLALSDSVQHTPVVVLGRGQFELEGAELGYWPSPHGLDGVIHLEARHDSARVRIGRGSRVNNGAVIISERGEINIGKRVLIGPEFVVLDSNFHSVDPSARSVGAIDSPGGVIIGDDVFIGQRVTILKGVRVGDRSVIGAGSVVSQDIPSDAIAAGNPCTVLRLLDKDQ